MNASSIGCREDYQGGSTRSVISGANKQAWFRCKPALQVYDPNWKQKGVYYGSWLTWTNYQQGRAKMRARLKIVYGFKQDNLFSGRLRPVDVVMDVTGSDHFPIQTVILVGHTID